MLLHRKRFAPLCLTIGLAAALAVTPRLSSAQAAPAPQSRAETLPDRLTSAEFWRLLNDISEPGGYFRIEDNFTSNEMEVGELFRMLRDRGRDGGVYMGVGPEQNLTYIAATRPKMAFIVDIRRQAVMQHLMFKAVFEMSKDRADFLSLLFSKPRPAGLDSNTTIPAMWEAYRVVATDSVLGRKNHTAIVERLTKHHGFTLDADERAKLDWVLDAFYAYGPSIQTSVPTGGRAGTVRGDFALLTGFSTDSKGVAHSFLSTEENYRIVKSLHDRNLIVPVSGDFGGPKAIRSIAKYMKDRGTTLNTYYLSNVEQYLFQDGKQATFYGNVSELPMDGTTLFLRPYSIGRGQFGGSPADTRSLCPLEQFLRSWNAGQIYSYDNALACR